MDYNSLFLQPSALDGIVGNDSSIGRLREFSVRVNSGSVERPVMLFGPPGTGKSAAVYALASESGWEIVELSASDYRDSDTIERVLMPAAVSRNIFGRRNLIVLDEIDELAGRFDTGASAAIVKLISASKNPVAFVANSFWDQRISFLRNLVDPVEFKRIDTRQVEMILESASKRNGIGANREAIAAIARRCNGDVRSALNDLFAFIGSPKNEEALRCMGERNAKKDIFQTLDKIFYSNTLISPLVAAANCDVDKEMLMRWIEENLCRRYKDRRDMLEAFSNLAKASEYSHRARMSQQYGLWRYMSVLLSSGIALAKSRYPSSAERYSFPGIIKQLSTAKSGKEKEIAIAEKLGKRVHGSVREIRSSVIPLVAEMSSKAHKEGTGKDADAFLEGMYGISKKELEYIRNSG